MELLQKRPQSAVGIVLLFRVWTLAQTSKPRLDRVRFPSRQTLGRAAGREGLGPLLKLRLLFSGNRGRGPLNCPDTPLCGMGTPREPGGVGVETGPQ